MKYLLLFLLLLSVQGATAQVSKPAKEADLLFQQSYEHMQSAHYFEAKTLLEKAAKLDPQSASIQYNLGVCYEKLGNTAKAISAYLNVLERNSHMSQAILNLAACYQKEENYSLALSYYKKFLQENPKAKERPYVDGQIEKLANESQSPPSAQDNTDDYLDAVTKTTSQARWQNRTIKVYIEQDLKYQAKSSSNYGIITQSFNEWSDATKGKITFSFVKEKSQANLTFKLTDSPLTNLSSTKLPEKYKRGNADIQIRGKAITHASISVSSQSPIDQALVTDDELKKSCLHEIGHALGLSGHSPNNHDVMFAIPDSSTVWPVLSKRDKATINKLYCQSNL